jgi:hypothetical protein
VVGGAESDVGVEAVVSGSVVAAVSVVSGSVVSGSVLAGDVVVAAAVVAGGSVCVVAGGAVVVGAVDESEPHDAARRQAVDSAVTRTRRRVVVGRGVIREQ